MTTTIVVAYGGEPPRTYIRNARLVVDRERLGLIGEDVEIGPVEQLTACAWLAAKNAGDIPGDLGLDDFIDMLDEVPDVELDEDAETPTDPRAS